MVLRRRPRSMRLKIRKERYEWYEIRMWFNIECEEHWDIELDSGNRTKNRNIGEESHHPIRIGVTTDAAWIFSW